MDGAIQPGSANAQPLKRRLFSWELGVWILIVCALGWLTAWRIMSYATGQDPRIYLHFAEDIRASGYSAAAIARCTDWVVPGYPLLLAGVLDTLGLFAAYWINLPVFFLAVGLLAKVLRRSAAPAEAGLALLVFFWIVVAGYPLNPHFLFLPFRGAIEWAWMFGAMAMTMPAFDPGRSDRFRCRRAAGAALFLAAGAVFRETIVFMAVPFGMIWLWQGIRGDRGAWKALAAFIAPAAAVALAIAGGMILQGKPLLNKQASLWLAGLLRGGLVKPFPLVLEAIVRLVFSELGVWGSIFLAAGTAWAFARREKTVFVLWTTSILLVLFYAFYKAHVRYTLSAVGLLAVVAGLGCAAVLSAAMRRLRPAGRQACSAAAALVFVALILRTIAGLETWGPRVSRADVKALQAHPVVAAPGVFIEREQRHLVDALLAFTDVSPKDPVAEGTNIARFAGAHFIHPVDDAGRMPVQKGVTGLDWLKHHFDLLPVTPDIAIGTSRAEVLRLAAWSRTHVAFDVFVEPGAESGVLWLDFKAGTAAETVQVEMRGGGAAMFRIPLNRPAGLVPVWIQGGLPRGTNLHVDIRSPLPLPANLDPVFIPAGGTRWLPMEEGRLPSTVRMLGEGFEEQPPAAKHGAAWRERAAIRLPALAGPAPAAAEIAVTLRLMPRPVSSSDIRGTLAAAGDSPPVSAWRIPAGGGERTVYWRGRLGSEPPTLALTADPWPADCWYLRMERIGVAFSEGN